MTDEGSAPDATSAIVAAAREEFVRLSVSEIRDEPLLRTIMRSEPEQLLLAVTTEGETAFVTYRTLLAARIDELIDTGELARIDSTKASEVMLRLGYSVALLPYGEVSGNSDDEVRAFAREFIVPLFQRPAG